MGGGQSTFCWRIDGFSYILQRETVQYYSLPFRYKGYNWKLSIAPKKSDESGNRFLGLYLNLDGGAYIPSDMEVHTVYQLCIYNQRNDNWDYFHSFEYNFRSANSGWGTRSMIALEQFQNPNNGFLVDDVCGFRVKMLSARRRRIGWKGFQRMLIEKPPQASSYKWNITDFAMKRKRSTFLTSGGFYAANHRWNVILYPNDSDTGRKFSYLSIFLKLVNPSTLPRNSKLHLEFSICLNDQINGKHKNLKGKSYFDSKRCVNGWRDFLPVEEFYDLSKGFIVADLCVVDVKITDWCWIYE